MVRVKVRVRLRLRLRLRLRPRLRLRVRVSVRLRLRLRLRLSGGRVCHMYTTCIHATSVQHLQEQEHEHRRRHRLQPEDCGPKTYGHCSFAACWRGLFGSCFEQPRPIGGRRTLEIRGFDLNMLLFSSGQLPPTKGSPTNS